MSKAWVWDDAVRQIEKEIEQTRGLLESPTLSPDLTTFHRGRLAALRGVLTLPNKPTPVDQTGESAMY